MSAVKNAPTSKQEKAFQAISLLFLDPTIPQPEMVRQLRELRDCIDDFLQDVEDGDWRDDERKPIEETT